MTTTPQKPDTTAAATDVGEFVTDLDGGQFERQFSIAVSRVAAAAIDHERKGKVKLELSFERIAGTSQVRIAHVLKFEHPRSNGRTAEEVDGATVMHVGRFGRLTLTQPRLFDAESQGRIDG